MKKWGDKQMLPLKPSEYVPVFNHEGLPLARTKSHTLALAEDDEGLRFEADLDLSDPDVQRIIPKLKRKDLNQKGRQVCGNCENGRTKSKVQVHSEMCNMLNSIYEKKNHDYGDSFAKLRNELPGAILVRIYDKYCRLKTLMQGAEQQVKDESIDDTLMDLANYCIMELVERKMVNGNY